MTRPKVPDDKRQRTAQACESCKRRKQKCNGLKPCHNCDRRKLTCTYLAGQGGDNGAAESAESPTKRRHIERSPPDLSSAPETSAASTSSAQHASPESTPSWRVPKMEGLKEDAAAATTAPPPTPPSALENHRRKESEIESEPHATHSTTSGQAEEAQIYTETRLLQDSTGRLLYIGDSSTLSFLALLRMIVENISSPEVGSPFIDDPKRHRIMENMIDFPENARIPSILPYRETTDILVQSYFTNTFGLVEIFDRKMFLEAVDTCYRDPLSADNYFLCQLFLVLALGLVLAAPIPGSHEEEIIRQQQSAKTDRAELFFRCAKSMCDPISGFEDADFWSVQALSLMALYMLAVSKRNAAYAYLGMAVRSAYALGLHREETLNEYIFSAEHIKVRRNLWKTLFILDRFLAASLGRPTAISDDDCSTRIMPEPASRIPWVTSGDDANSVHADGLDACIRWCHIIGITLKIFSKRKISTVECQKIADMCKDWSRDMRDNFQIRHPPNERSLAQSIAILHADLFSLHTSILLTRQFFVFHIWKRQEKRAGKSNWEPRAGSPIDKFSQLCVIASLKTIKTVQRAREGKYLAQRNPFIIYFLFAASLVVLTNQFASLHSTDNYAQSIKDAIDVMQYCAEIDPQAQRLYDIMIRFSKVVDNWRKEYTYSGPVLPDRTSLYSPIATGGFQQLPHERGHPHSMSASSSGSIGSIMGTQLPSMRQIPGISGLTSPTVLPRLAAISDPSSLMSHPPPQISHHTSAILHDTRMEGMSMTPPPHTSAATTLPPPTSLLSPRPGGGMLGVHHSPHHQTQHHPIMDNSEPLSGDVDFEFDTLWNWGTTAPALPVSTTPGGVGQGSGGPLGMGNLISPFHPPMHPGAAAAAPPPMFHHTGYHHHAAGESRVTSAAPHPPGSSTAVSVTGLGSTGGNMPLYHASSYC